MSAPEQVEVRASSDPVKRDVELVCRLCDAVLCDVEPGDALDVLVSVGRDHRCAWAPPLDDEAARDALANHGDLCDSQQHGLWCTRTAGHAGEHASANRTQVLARWAP